MIRLENNNFPCRLGDTELPHFSCHFDHHITDAPEGQFEVA